MNIGRAKLRQTMEQIEGVHRTWIEHDLRAGGTLQRTLVVEVSFDTDPNSPYSNTGALDDIALTFRDAMATQTMNYHHLRIVPRLPNSGTDK